MKKENIKYIIISAVSFVLLAILGVYYFINRFSETLMPSMDFQGGLASGPVLLLGVAVQFFCLWKFMKQPPLKSCAAALLSKLVSIAPSFITTLIVGLLVELLKGFLPTYHIISWLIHMVFVIALYAALEALTVKLFFKIPFKKAFLWLSLSNAVTIVICFLVNLPNWMSYIHFSF